MTSDQADVLITYLQVMENKTRHESNMREVQETGVTEKELDEACRALGKIAGRDYSIL